MSGRKAKERRRQEKERTQKDVAMNNDEMLRCLSEILAIAVQLEDQLPVGHPDIDEVWGEFRGCALMFAHVTGAVSIEYEVRGEIRLLEFERLQDQLAFAEDGGTE